MQTNIKSLIKNARDASRDVLRTEKVSNLLGYIATIEAKINGLTTNRETIIERQEKEAERQLKILARAKHQLAVAEETNNPDLDAFERDYKATQENYSKFVEEVKVPNKREIEDYDTSSTTRKVTLDKKLAEYEEKIENWKTGKSKVCKETMQSMALDMIKARIGASFNQGHYDEATAEIEAGETEAPTETSPEEAS